MVYFDLDGVIRWLTFDLRGGKSSRTWSEPLPDGRNMCDAISANLDYLLTAPVTPYYDVIKTLPEIHIITHPQPGWKVNTIKWIENHFDSHKLNIHMVKAPEEKMAFLGEGDLLVEDYPFFKDYSKIVLIDWPYNRCVENPFLRIREPQQLRNFLNYRRSLDEISNDIKSMCL